MQDTSNASALDFSFKKPSLNVIRNVKNAKSFKTNSQKRYGDGVIESRRNVSKQGTSTDNTVDYATGHVISSDDKQQNVNNGSITVEQRKVNETLVKPSCNSHDQLTYPKVEDVGSTQLKAAFDDCSVNRKKLYESVYNYPSGLKKHLPYNDLILYHISPHVSSTTVPLNKRKTDGPNTQPKKRNEANNKKPNVSHYKEQMASKESSTPNNANRKESSTSNNANRKESSTSNNANQKESCTSNNVNRKESSTSNNANRKIQARNCQRANQSNDYNENIQFHHSSGKIQTHADEMNRELSFRHLNQPFNRNDADREGKYCNALNDVSKKSPHFHPTATSVHRKGHTDNNQYDRKQDIDVNNIHYSCNNTVRDKEYPVTCLNKIGKYDNNIQHDSPYLHTETQIGFESNSNRDPIQADGLSNSSPGCHRLGYAHLNDTMSSTKGISGFSAHKACIGYADSPQYFKNSITYPSQCHKQNLPISEDHSVDDNNLKQYVRTRVDFDSTTSTNRECTYRDRNVKKDCLQQIMTPANRNHRYNDFYFNSSRDQSNESYISSSPPYLFTSAIQNEDRNILYQSQQMCNFSNDDPDNIQLYPSHSTQPRFSITAPNEDIFPPHHQNIFSVETPEISTLIYQNNIYHNANLGSNHPRQSKHEQQKDRKVQVRQRLPPCRVCGGKASGLHFGVNTCEACNEFFRRNIGRQPRTGHFCSHQLKSKVLGKKRSPCSYCRYQRCLVVGMSRDVIKTGRYSHKTQADYVREIEDDQRQFRLQSYGSNPPL